MIEMLIDHIKCLIPVSDELKKRLEEISNIKIIEKGKYLHKPLRICENTYFINAGLLRVFYKKGEKEITDNFSAEGEWITSIYSFMKNVPDNFYVETLEKSELVAINILDLEKCFKEFPEMDRFGRILISKYFVQKSERIISIQFHSAIEKYQFFCNSYKNILPRVPLGMLSSYLGITQETLSRIRSIK
jgi:CRP-like cAMP-binding protein